MLGLLLGAAWLTALRVWLRIHLALNSDALSVPDLWLSLKQGGRLGDWSMGNHAYVFPDLVFYQASTWLAPDLAGRQVAYGLIQGFLLWWLGTALVARLWDLRRAEARAYVAAGLLAVLPFLDEASGLGQWFFPAHHGGALLASVGLAAWTLKQEWTLSSWFKVLLVGLACGLGHASDGVFATWVLLPSLCLSLGLAGPARGRVWAVAALSFVSKACWHAHWKAQGMRLLSFKWGVFHEHAGELLAKVWGQAAAYAQSYGLAVALAALLAAFLVAAWRRQPLAAWLGLAWFAMLGVALALSALSGQLAGRYLTWCLWVPALLAPAWVAQRWQDWRGLAVLVPASAGLLWALLQPANRALTLEQRQSAWLQQQLAPRGLSQGWADYWHARPQRLLSAQPLQLLPVISEWGALQPFDWVSRRQDFAWDPDLKKAQFVLMNGLDEAKMAARFKGRPLKLEGEGLQLWIYKEQR